MSTKVDPQHEFKTDLDIVIASLRELLVRKNKAYGNSVFEPVRCFSKASNVEQIKVRIDDKLSRMFSGTQDSEDTEGDLIGYLLIHEIAKLRASREEPCK
jgi:hypothetical protein